MGKQDSTRESDGLVWVPVSMRLGEHGLDLRRSDSQDALTELLNARFIDNKTVGRRDGHLGRLVQSQSMFNLNAKTTNQWVYGHGTLVTISGAAYYENAKHPINKRGGGVMDLDDVSVVWTGDRLLVVSNDGPFYGSSPHWDRTT